MAAPNVFYASELLLLFVVVTTGLLLGRIRVAGVSLGVAGVLFAGLGWGLVGHTEERALALSTALRDFGLVVFVYAVGLTSGPGFFAALRRRGLAMNAAVGVALGVGAGVSLLVGRWLDLSPGLIAGGFCGSLTNTPALAAVVELARGEAAREASLGYSVAYPIGIAFGLSILQLLVWRRREAFAAERASARDRRVQLRTASFEITNPEVIGRAIGELRVRDETGLLISRIRHRDEVRVPNKYTVLHRGDVVVAVGPPDRVDAAVAYFGATSAEHLAEQREQVDMRRILVSRKDLVGKTLGALELDRRFNAQVTRLRRADAELFPSNDVRLELGDRLRIVAPKDRLPALAQLFGDSDREAGDVDFLALAIGIALGLLVGMLPIPTPQGAVRLGNAGGPLIVALVLGRLGRTGRFLWSMPFESNRLLRELGLLLFLATVGVTAGNQLAMGAGALGLKVMAVALAVTVVSNVLLVVMLARIMHTGVVPSLGAATGMQTQPATLAAANELAGGDEDVFLHYALVYPIAMVGKILLAQLVYMLARGM